LVIGHSSGASRERSNAFHVRFFPPADKLFASRIALVLLRFEVSLFSFSEFPSVDAVICDAPWQLASSSPATHIRHSRIRKEPQTRFLLFISVSLSFSWALHRRPSFCCSLPAGANLTDFSELLSLSNSAGIISFQSSTNSALSLLPNFFLWRPLARYGSISRPECR